MPEGYDVSKLSIGTLGSHSALNILRGAKDEGFRTVVVCRHGDEIVYERFRVADVVIGVESFEELADDEIQERLLELNTILVPHGSFNAYIPTEKLLKLRVPVFGNKQLLVWEASRELQERWLRMAGLRLPKVFKSPDEIDRLVIVKFPGARGGRGYFLASSPEDFWRRAESLLKSGVLREEDLRDVHIQEYVIGVNVYPSYFRSLLHEEVELLAIDRRYESNVDALWKVPAAEQLRLGLSPTYTVVGNIPLTLRESLLAEILRMGDAVAEASKRIAAPGVIGAFCLETVVTENLEIYTFEVSARIVAGTNVGIGTSPYAYLRHGANMYMGRRIAREIREAAGQGRLEEILT
ncbi:MAG: formate--phosphoribosylaminoimidazolecarboxamide ligase [Candidatus Alkanophagales archaeon]